MQFMPSKFWKKLIIEALMDKLCLLQSIMHTILICATFGK